VFYISQYISTGFHCVVVGSILLGHNTVSLGNSLLMFRRAFQYEKNPEDVHAAFF